jgi:ATP-binding cassette subfamily C protein
MEIARSLIRNPSLLILDEATSALDPVTEARVDDNLRRRGCTCLIIAHRLSTIRDCDEIIVLRQGHVLERGTHDALMADRNGFYHELQSLQDELAGDFLGPLTQTEFRVNRIVVPSASFGVSTNGLDREGRRSADPTGQEPAPEAEAVLAESTAVLDLFAELNSHAEIVTTAANQPLPLDDRGAVWKVISGQVDIFHTQPDAAQMQSRRRHFCRVEEGGAIFAIEDVRGEDCGEFIAVGVGPAELRKMAKTDLMRLSFDPQCRREVADLINDWVDRVSRATVPTEPPLAAVHLEVRQPRTFEPGQAIASRNQVLWIRHDGQDIHLFGEIIVPPCDYSSRFPLASSAWLSFDQPGRVEGIDTESFMENGDPWLGLKRFHKSILDAIARARRREIAQIESRRERLVRYDNEVFRDAIAKLSLESRKPVLKAADPTEVDRLISACQTVGSALGIQVTAPFLDGTDDPLRLIARASGFRTRRVRLSVDWWKADTGPLLGFLSDGNIPIALIRGRGGGYELVDRFRGVRIPVDARVAGTLAPSAVIFHRTLTDERPSTWDLIRFSLPVVRRELRAFLVLGSLAGLVGLAIPVVAATVIDQAIPRADQQQLVVLCIFLAAIGVAVASFQWIQSLVLVRLRGRLESDVVAAAWDRLLNLPTRFFSAHESGDLALRAMGLNQVITMLASTWATSLLVGVFSLLNLLILLAYNTRLALIALALVVLSPLSVSVIIRPLWRCQRKLLRIQGEISAFLLILIGGISRLRVTGAEKRAFAQWAAKYKRQLGFMLRLQAHADRLLFFCELWPLLVSMIIFALFFSFGTTMATAGEFLAFNLAVTQALAAMIGIIHGIPSVLDGVEQYQRFRPILEESPEGGEIQGEVLGLRGAIRLANVSFQYSPSGPLVLDSVNIQVRPGEFVAIVGPSGSGKSTLFRLLLGFESPTEGTVSYDGRELSTLDIQEVRRQLGVVLQDAQLRTGDIFSNIVGNSPSLTKADAWRAAELAGLADDVEQMPMGIHTVIGEGGGGLSSGQRQRLLIARALASHPKILMFDEATSALDNQLQALISASVHSRLQGTTRLVIAHRLSTIIGADRIYVLSGGQVVQSGEYARLIEEPGPFQNLARRQMLA